MFKVYKSKLNTFLTEKEKRCRMKELQAKILEVDPNTRTDDTYLTRWLSCREWDVEAAFHRRRKHYRFRKTHPDIFPANKKITEFDYILQKQIGYMLEDRDKNGRRVYLAHANRIDLTEYTMEEKIQMDTLWFDMVVEELETIKNGVTVIIDMKDISWNTVKWCLNSEKIKICGRYAGFVPLQYVEIHFINVSPLANLIFSFGYPFLTDGLKERIHFHRSNLKALYKRIGREFLPKEYGGEKNINLKAIYSKLYEFYKYQPMTKKSWFKSIRAEEKQAAGRIESRMG